MKLYSRLLATTSSFILFSTVVNAPAFAQNTPTTPAGAQAADATGQAPGEATSDQVADQAAAPTGSAQGSGPDIIVTGIRGSLAGAQDIKRNADAIVDALVAEDIGKFPDNNASEAIARITGVQVTRFADEANGVLIRGLPNVQTTVQGREIFTADGRSVAIQDFPAQAVSRVDVYKAITAQNLEGGIAGLIDVGLRRPFDFQGFQLAGAARGVYNTESRKLDPIGSLLVSDRWQTGIGEIGALLNVSFTQTRYLNSVRYQGFQDNVPAAQQVLPTSVGRSFTFPQDIGLFYGRGNRQRPSVNGSLQWRPADNLTLYADGLWQAYRNRNANDFFGIAVQRGANEPQPTIRNAVLTADRSTLQSFDVDLGIVNGPTKQAGRGRTDTFQGALGGKWETGNAVFTTDLAYTKSIVDNTYYEFQTTLANPLSLAVRLNAERSVDFVPSGVDFDNPSSYFMRGLYENRQRSTGGQWQWQGNLDLDTGSSLLPKFKFGLRYADRTASSTFGDRYASLGSLRDPITLVPGVSDGGIIEAGFHGDDVQQFRSWFAPNADIINDRINDIRDYTRQALVRANADAGTRQAWAPERPALNPLSAFSAREQVYSGYAQLDYALDIGIPVDGVIGTRMVITRNRLEGTNSLPDANGVTRLVPIASSTQYVDVLPNISAQLHFTDRLKLRLSRTEALTRPGFNQINPTLTVQQGTIGGNISFTGTGGNPDLQPIRSDNYDASLEYYFSRTGSVSVAGFYREINGFINSLPQRLNVAPFGDILVYRPSNAASGKIKGIEAAATTFFDFLPGALRGLGAQANFTYIDGEQTLPSAENLVGGRNTLPGVSKYSFNVIGLYELGATSVRLAYNYRSANVDGFGAPGVFTTVYSDAVGRLDLSASYNLNSNVTLTVDATNLLRTPYHSYVKSPEYPRDVRWEASLLSAGVRFRF